MARKKRVNPDTVVDAIIESPNESMTKIAQKTGLSRSGLDYVLKTPDTINTFRRRLGAANVTGNAAGSIGRILAALGAITDSVLDDPANLTHQDVDDLTRVLAALTGTLERLGRAGISLAGLHDPDDDSAIGAYGLECWARGARWADGRTAARIARGAQTADRWAREKADNADKPE